MSAIAHAAPAGAYVPTQRVEWRSFFSLAMQLRQQAKQYRRWAAEYAGINRLDLEAEWLQKSTHAWDCAYFYLGQAMSWKDHPRNTRKEH